MNNMWLLGHNKRTTSITSPVKWKYHSIIKISLRKYAHKFPRQTKIPLKNQHRIRHTVMTIPSRKLARQRKVGAAGRNINLSAIHGRENPCPCAGYQSYAAPSTTKCLSPREPAESREERGARRAVRPPARWNFRRGCREFPALPKQPGTKFNVLSSWTPKFLPTVFGLGRTSCGDSLTVRFFTVLWNFWMLLCFTFGVTVIVISQLLLSSLLLLSGRFCVFWIFVKDAWIFLSGSGFWRLHHPFTLFE